MIEDGILLQQDGALLTGWSYRGPDMMSASAAEMDALSAGLRLKLFTGVFISASLFALAAPIADAYGAKSMTTPLRLVSVAVLGESLLMLWTNASGKPYIYALYQNNIYERYPDVTP